MTTGWHNSDGAGFKKIGLLSIAIYMILILGCSSVPRESKPGTAIPQGLSLLNPEQTLLYNQALSLMQRKDYKDAQVLFATLLKQTPLVNELSLNSALCLYYENNYREAMTVVAPLLTMNVAPAHNLAGLIEQSLHNFDGAKIHYQKALSKDPTYANALYNMALLYDVYYQEVDRAIDFYSRYLEQAADDEQTQGWLDQLKSAYQEVDL